MSGVVLPPIAPGDPGYQGGKNGGNNGDGKKKRYEGGHEEPSDRC